MSSVQCPVSTAELLYGLAQLMLYYSCLVFMCCRRGSVRLLQLAVGAYAGRLLVGGLLPRLHQHVLRSELSVRRARCGGVRQGAQLRHFSGALLQRGGGGHRGEVYGGADVEGWSCGCGDGRGRGWGCNWCCGSWRDSSCQQCLCCKTTTWLPVCQPAGQSVGLSVPYRRWCLCWCISACCRAS